jgi:hypothetical protein
METLRKSGGWGQGGSFVLAAPSLGEIEEIPQDRRAMLGGDALRMKLDAVDRQLPMRERHDQAVIGLRLDIEDGRAAVAVDDERMIARRLQRPVDAAVQPARPVEDRLDLAVHR